MARTITREAPLRKEAPGRRDRLLRRLLPVLVLAAIALLVGVVVGASHVPAERKIAERFAQDWERGDYGAMYDLIDGRRQATGDAAAVRRRLPAAAATATVTARPPGKAPRPQGGAVRLPVAVRTRISGTLPGDARAAVQRRRRRRAAWTGAPNLVFPGSQPGRQLTRNTALGQRGDILARNGQPLGQRRRSARRLPEAQSLAGEIAGKPGPVQRHALRPLGYPPDARVGISGLERAFDRQLAGQPGGVLRAGGHMIATSTPKAGANVRTTIDPAVAEARRSAALAGRFGGIAAITPATARSWRWPASPARPPAAGLDVQDHHADRGARGQRGQAVDRLPVPDRRRPRGRPTRERQRRVVRRHAGELVRELVQLGVRPARAPRSGAQKLVATAERSASTSRPTSPAPPLARSPRPTRSATTSRSARRRSARARSWPRALEMAVVAATIAERGLRAAAALDLRRRAAAARA